MINSSQQNNLKANNVSDSNDTQNKFVKKEFKNTEKFSAVSKANYFTAAKKAPKALQDPKTKLQTGRRKNAVARVSIKPGNGKFTVNKINLDQYFVRDSLKSIILNPFNVTNTLNQYDIAATVVGGGHSGQAGAIRLGISRALDKQDESYRRLLKTEGLLTCDSRVVERKKYGKRKARRSTQFSKR